jgi:cell division protease FtsH
VVAELKALAKDIEEYQHGAGEVKLPPGFLLHGPPGTGKSFVVRAFAGEASCPLFNVNTSKLLSSPYKGQWVTEIINLFKEAREARNAETKRLRSLPGATGNERGVVVIFLDEFEGFGRSRSHSGGWTSDEERMRAVDAYLAELDGVEKGKNDGIIVITATNYPDQLDDALRRPGRTAKEFHLNKARTKAERLDVLSKAAKREVTDLGFTLEDPKILDYLARITSDSSNDHLRGILQRATELARRDGRKVITQADAFEAYQRQKFGVIHEDGAVTKKSPLVSAHENGHGLLAAACGLKPMVVSMVPRGETLGRVVTDSDGLMEQPLTPDDLLKALLIKIGGRAGELEQFGQAGASAGVSGDFADAREIIKLLLANGMVGELYATDVSSLTDKDIPDEYKALANQLFQSALTASKDVLDCIDEGTRKRIVDESLSMKKELVGDEAATFYDRYLTPDVRHKMEARVKEFVEHPLAV